MLSSLKPQMVEEKAEPEIIQTPEVENISQQETQIVQQTSIYEQP